MQIYLEESSNSCWIAQNDSWIGIWNRRGSHNKCKYSAEAIYFTLTELINVCFHYYLSYKMG